MKRTRIAGRSAKRAGDGYGDWVGDQLADDDRCHVGPLLRLVNPGWAGCTGKAQGMHHLRKQGAGAARLSPEGTLRSCNPCNGRIEDEPDEAREAGLVVRESDVVWADLGARAAREAVDAEG